MYITYRNWLLVKYIDLKNKFCVQSRLRTLLPTKERFKNGVEKNCFKQSSFTQKEKKTIILTFTDSDTNNNHETRIKVNNLEVRQKVSFLCVPTSTTLLNFGVQQL